MKKRSHLPGLIFALALSLIGGPLSMAAEADLDRDRDRDRRVRATCDVLYYRVLGMIPVKRFSASAYGFSYRNAKRRACDEAYEDCEYYAHRRARGQCKVVEEF